MMCQQTEEQKTDSRKIFSLYAVTRNIQKTLEQRYTSSFWVRAEMTKLNFYKHSGHCYPDLVEKRGGKVIAQMRSHLWSDNYKKINNKFLKMLNEPLKDGTKILFQARIVFDPSHGLTLNILDIDPQFTLGDLEREKQETIRKLKEENLFDKNKSLKLPLLPKRIAVISVETSKGYADFLNIINRNSQKYKITHALFPSLLQGDMAAFQIITQLNFIKEVAEQFDLVAIIRGGGGEIGLSCYNNYQLAKTICSFPLPVITGIGHSTNETISEMVSYANAITPTKLAEDLLQKFEKYAEVIARSRLKIQNKSTYLVYQYRTKLETMKKSLLSSLSNILIINRNKLGIIHNTILQQSLFCLKKEQLKVKSLSQSINNLDPKNVLNRGYSITLYKGKSIQNLQKLKKGDKIETVLEAGKITSIVESTN